MVNNSFRENLQWIKDKAKNFGHVITHLPLHSLHRPPVHNKNIVGTDKENEAMWLMILMT